MPTVVSGGVGAIAERFDGIGRHLLPIRVDTGAPAVSVVRVDP